MTRVYGRWGLFCGTWRTQPSTPSRSRRRSSRVASALVLGFALAATACDGSSSPVNAPGNIDTNASSLAGTWVLSTAATTGGAPFFQSLSVTVNPTPTNGSAPGGQTTATVQGCPSATYIYACQLNGIVIGTTVDQGAAMIDLSFVNAPVGATIDGTVYTDGTLRGTLTVRDDGTSSTVAVTLKRQ